MQDRSAGDTAKVSHGRKRRMMGMRRRWIITSVFPVITILMLIATLPYLLQMADKGFKKAMEDNRLLRLGMTCYDGKLTLKETALKQNREWTDADELDKVW